MPFLTHPAIDAQRRIDEPGALHVDPDEVAETRRPHDEPAQAPEGELLLHEQPEVGELHRDVAAQPLGRDSLQHLGVDLDHCPGPGSVGRVLSEQRRVRVKARVVQAADHPDAVVQRLPGDEACGAEPHPVAADEAPDRRAPGSCEDRAS